MEKNSLYEVNEKHKYWFQSQMHMGITKLSLSDFVTFINLIFPILVQKVKFPSRWQCEIKSRLLAFHEKCIKDKNLQLLELSIVSNILNLTCRKSKPKSEFLTKLAVL